MPCSYPRGSDLPDICTVHGTPPDSMMYTNTSSSTCNNAAEEVGIPSSSFENLVDGTRWFLPIIVANWEVIRSGYDRDDKRSLMGITTVDLATTSAADV